MAISGVSGGNDYPEENMGNNYSKGMHSDAFQDLYDNIEVSLFDAGKQGENKLRNTLGMIKKAEQLNEGIFTDYLSEPFKNKCFNVNLNESFQWENDKDNDLDKTTLNNILKGGAEFNLPENRFAITASGEYTVKNNNKDGDLKKDSEYCIDVMTKYQPSKNGMRYGAEVYTSKFNAEGDGTTHLTLGALTKEGLEIGLKKTTDINVDPLTGDKNKVSRSSSFVKFVNNYNPNQSAEEKTNNYSDEGKGLDVALIMENNPLDNLVGLKLEHTWDLKDKFKIENDNVNWTLSAGGCIGESNPSEDDQSYLGRLIFDTNYTNNSSTLKTSAEATLNYEMADIKFDDFSPKHTLSGKAGVSVAKNFSNNKSGYITAVTDFVKTKENTVINSSLTAGCEVANNLTVSLKGNINAINKTNVNKSVGVDIKYTF